MHEQFKVLDLFSGIGGFSLGLERAGMRTVAFCEIEPFPRAVLAKHWPHVPCYDDVRTLTAERLAADGIAVDVICGGFPCQDISFAGLGAGLAGERSGLWSEYARLIRELRPRYVIVENVAALLSRGLGDVLGDLAEIGYGAWWDCIPASAIGAPHRRDRLWLVAYPGGEQHEGRGLAIRRQIASQLFGTAMADAAGDGRGEGRADGRGRTKGSEPQQGAGPNERRDDAPLADAFSERGRGRLDTRQDAIHADARREAVGAGGNGGWWAVEPDVGRVAHGVPARSHRLRGLGNAVVPQIPEIIARAILSSEGLAA